MAIMCRSWKGIHMIFWFGKNPLETLFPSTAGMIDIRAIVKLPTTSNQECSLSLCTVNGHDTRWVVKEGDIRKSCVVYEHSVCQSADSKFMGSMYIQVPKVEPSDPKVTWNWLKEGQEGLVKLYIELSTFWVSEYSIILSVKLLFFSLPHTNKPDPIRSYCHQNY